MADFDTIMVQALQYILDQAEFVKRSIQKEDHTQIIEDYKVLLSYTEEFKIYLEQNKSKLLSTQALMSSQKILNAYKANKFLDHHALETLIIKNRETKTDSSTAVRRPI